MSVGPTAVFPVPEAPHSSWPGWLQSRVPEDEEVQDNVEGVCLPVLLGGQPGPADIREVRGVPRPSASFLSAFMQVDQLICHRRTASFTADPEASFF